VKVKNKKLRKLKKKGEIKLSFHILIPPFFCSAKAKSRPSLTIFDPSSVNLALNFHSFALSLPFVLEVKEFSSFT